jgi:ABC-type oligopeptide transport system substrate-binding subunit
MLCLAYTGQRAAALAQYESCRSLLEEELGVELDAETTALFQRIRAGEPEITTPPADPISLQMTEIPPAPPAFLASSAGPKTSSRPVFVARERELTRLRGFLQNALTGKGQVSFVIGGPGRGKTALINEFARRAMDVHPELLVAHGVCNAYSGVGDPYLPFREILGQLTGNVEAEWAAGVITSEHARRLWDTLPLTAQALVDAGPDLIDTFVPATALMGRVGAHEASGSGDAAWLARFEELAERKTAFVRDRNLQQSALFAQYTQVLGTVACQRPLLLVLDDLQWADAGSIGLLFHMRHELAGSRILVLGAYRAEEVAMGRPSAAGTRKRHPLEQALAEFKRRFGDVWLDLGQAGRSEGRQFVDAILDTEPNRLGEAFRSTMFQHTEGHALFTLELLHAMRERGDLVQDEQGQWVEAAALNWGTLPQRVEGVIEERMRRLEPELLEILTVASVEGEQFTAQVVAQVQETGERQVLRALSHDLEKRHRLVREQEVIAVGDQRLSRYRFAHALFQRYLYNSLSEGETMLLHREIAEVLEELYQGHTEEITAQLAHQYAEAGWGEKAVAYLLRAGDEARLAYAYEEAIDQYERALAFLKASAARADAPERVHARAGRTLMRLGLTYAISFDFKAARQAYDEGFALWQRAAQSQQQGILPPAPHALRIAMPNPPTLDPTLVIGSPLVVDQLFSGLMEPDTTGVGVVPDVSQGWEILEGGRKYVFHLRDDVHWSDGVPVTAGDFECALKRVLDPATGALNAYSLYGLKGAYAFHLGKGTQGDVGVRAINDRTLIVEMERPTGFDFFAVGLCYPVPRHVVESRGDEWTRADYIVTNGPFQLQAWRPGGITVLSRNPQHHAQIRGNVQQIELNLGMDPSSQLGMYEADRLDFLYTGLLPVAERDHAQQWHAGDLIPLAYKTTHYLGFDVRRPPFDDVRLRRAFAHAVDQETLAAKVSSGFAVPATGGFVPAGMAGHSADIGLPFDPECGRRLLAEANYPEGHGFPAIDALMSQRDRSLGEHLQKQLRENLDIEVKWATLEVGMYVRKMKEQPPQIFLMDWEGDSSDSFLRQSTVRLRTGWQNQTYNTLVEQALFIAVPEEKKKLHAQADRILVEEAPIIPLTYSQAHVLAKPWVRFAAPAYVSSCWRGIVIEPH